VENESNENEVLQGHPAGAGFEMEEAEDQDVGPLPEEEIRALEEKNQRLEELNERLELQESEEEWSRKVAETEQAVKEEFRNIEREKLQTIEGLDPDADDYDDQVSEILADAELKRGTLFRQHPEIIKGPPRPEADPEITHRRAVRQANAFLESAAWKAGVDPGDPVFQKICRETEATGSFESQVENAIKRFKDSQKRAKKEGIQSLDDVLHEEENRRRLTSNDILHRR